MLLQSCRILIALLLLLHSQATTLLSDKRHTTTTSLPLPSPNPIQSHSRTVFLVIVLPPDTSNNTSPMQGQANTNPSTERPSKHPHIYLRLAASETEPAVPTSLLTVYRWSAPAYAPTWYTLYSAWLWERASAPESIAYGRLGEMRIPTSSGDRQWMFRIGTTDIENTDILNPYDGEVRDAAMPFLLHLLLASLSDVNAVNPLLTSFRCDYNLFSH